MAGFIFTAQSKEGHIINGRVEAASRDAALTAITHQGHKPISITKEKKKGLEIPFLKQKVSSNDLVIFTRQLSTMVSAGVPLLRAITTLSQQSSSKRLQEALDAVTKDVESGRSLGLAFEKHPDIFSDIYINMVKAGEAGGILDEILKRLAVQQEKNNSIRKKVKSAMTYPMILVVITVGSFFGLMLFVIPQIGRILNDLAGPEAELPAITKIMIGISTFMVQYWYIILIVTIGVIFGLRKYLRTKNGRSQFHHLIIKIPKVGEIIKKIAVARFARTFASLIGAGVSVLETLRVTGDAIGNEAFKEELARGAESVKGGEQLSEAIARGGLFPAIVPQMLAVGEETGKTGEILIKIADFYEEEVDAAISSLNSIIEPVMIVIMGSMVGLIAVSVMGPIASLSQNIR